MPTELAAEALRWSCDPDALGFKTTAEIAPLELMSGQDRGVDALQLAIDVAGPGYNAFAVGESGTGRATMVRTLVERAAATRPATADWVYLHNFDDPYRPVAVELPAGQGPVLARDLKRFIEQCKEQIPRAFEGDDYARRRRLLTDELDSRRRSLLEEASSFAKKNDFHLEIGAIGVATLPLQDGRPLSNEAFVLLPAERRAEIAAKGELVKQKIDETLRAMRRAERETHEQIHALDREVAIFAVGHELDVLREAHGGVDALRRHLERVQEDLTEHIDAFRDGDKSLPPFLDAPAPFERWVANVLVTNDPTRGAPVVIEPNPTYYNLLGKIDYRATIAAMHTDFTLIKPGALHRANGGFLVVHARDLLMSAFAYEALKRAIREGEIRMENLGEQYSAVPTTGLKPSPIPLSVRVVMIGDHLTYTVLHRLDDAFSELFKVKAEFASSTPRTADAERAVAGFVRRTAERCALPPFTASAVARLLEEAARLAGHQERLTMDLNALEELATESAHWARGGGADRVEAEHVEKAVSQREHRSNLPEQELQRLIGEGTLSISVRGRVVGQVHGLSVMDVGDYSFARPTRITARTGIGGDGVVDIEREAELSGATHSKGVLILGGYLIGAYAAEHPLALSGRLTFEQTYSEVEGDSASSAELYALLSSLSGLPLHQGIAVTGSVDQRGAIQSVGAVTRKVEGHYAVCAAQGLTGEQGVIIPSANTRHLMLRRDVMDAVRRGAFHVWPVSSIDEGLRILTGVEAGLRRSDGSYEEGSVHALVQARLAGYSRRLAELTGRAGSLGEPAARGREAVHATDAIGGQAASSAGTW